MRAESRAFTGRDGARTRLSQTAADSDGRSGQPERLASKAMGHVGKAVRCLRYCSLSDPDRQMTASSLTARVRGRSEERSVCDWSASRPLDSAPQEAVVTDGGVTTPQPYRREMLLCQRFKGHGSALTAAVVVNDSREAPLD